MSRCSNGSTNFVINETSAYEKLNTLRDITKNKLVKNKLEGINLFIKCFIEIDSTKCKQIS